MKSYSSSGKATILAQAIIAQKHCVKIMKKTKLLVLGPYKKNTPATSKTLFNCKYSTNEYLNQISQHVLQDKSFILPYPNLSYLKNNLK